MQGPRGNEGGIDPERGVMMSAEALIAEGDWDAPATKGDLLLLRSDLETKIRNVDSKVDKVHSDLRIEIAKLSGELGGEIAKLRVSMAWMTLAVVAGLGGLITLFEFMS